MRQVELWAWSVSGCVTGSTGGPEGGQEDGKRASCKAEPRRRGGNDKLRQNWLAKHLKDKAVTSLQARTRAESEDGREGDKGAGR